MNNKWIIQFRALILSLPLVGLLAGCQTSPQANNQSPIPQSFSSMSQPTSNKTKTIAQSSLFNAGLSMSTSQNGYRRPINKVQAKLLQEFANWQGVPYHLGGMSREGIDCSALVQAIFAAQFDMNLPRTTLSQREIGRQVQRNNLQVGDLVFFKIPGPTGRHIGIYLGNNDFIHASTTKGVTISSLENQYWKKRYQTARRVLTHENIG